MNYSSQCRHSGSRYTPSTTANRLLHQVEIDVILQRASDNSLFNRPHCIQKPVSSNAWLNTQPVGPFSTEDCASAQRLHEAASNGALSTTLPNAPLTDDERGIALRLLQDLGCDDGLTVAGHLLHTVAADLIDVARTRPTGEPPPRESWESWLDLLGAAKARMPPNTFSALLAKAAASATASTLLPLSGPERAVAVRVFRHFAGPNLQQRVSSAQLEQLYQSASEPALVQGVLEPRLRDSSEGVSLEHWMGALSRIKCADQATLNAVLDSLAEATDHTGGIEASATQLFAAIAGEGRAVAVRWLKDAARGDLGAGGDEWCSLAQELVPELISELLDDGWLSEAQWCTRLKQLHRAHGPLVYARWIKGCQQAATQHSALLLEDAEQQRAALWGEQLAMQQRLLELQSELQECTRQKGSSQRQVENKQAELRTMRGELTAYSKQQQHLDNEWEQTHAQLQEVQGKLEQQQLAVCTMEHQTRAALNQLDQLTHRRAEGDWLQQHQQSAMVAEREVLIDTLAHQQVKMETDQYNDRLRNRAIEQAAEARSAAVVASCLPAQTVEVPGAPSDQLSDPQWHQAQEAFKAADPHGHYEIEIALVERATRHPLLHSAAAQQWEASLAVLAATSDADVVTAISFDDWMTLLIRAPDNHRQPMIEALRAEAMEAMSSPTQKPAAPAEVDSNDQ